MLSCFQMLVAVAPSGAAAEQSTPPPGRLVDEGVVNHCFQRHIVRVANACLACEHTIVRSFCRWLALNRAEKTP